MKYVRYTIPFAFICSSCRLYTHKIRRSRFQVCLTCFRWSPCVFLFLFSFFNPPAYPCVCISYTPEYQVIYSYAPYETAKVDCFTFIMPRLPLYFYYSGVLFIICVFAFGCDRHRYYNEARPRERSDRRRFLLLVYGGTWYIVIRT